MSKAYCTCCRKETPHKVVMKRCQTEPCSTWQTVQRFFALIAQGEAYYKMEKQGFCRVCNNPSTLSHTDFSRVRVF